MARRRWRQCPETGALIEIPLDSVGRPRREGSVAIHGDIEAFKSPIDGSIISDRAQLREHKRKHDVVNLGEFGPDNGREFFQRKAKERVNHPFSAKEKRARREALVRAYDKLRGNS